MEMIEEKELITCLRNFKDIGIYIKTEGMVSSMNTIHKLDFSIQYDVLRLKDKITKNYFTINLNQVYKILASSDRKTVKLYIDNDILVTIID